MRRIVYLMTIVLAALLLGACNRGGNKRSSLNIFTPTSSGRAYELLVVCDDANWEAWQAVHYMTYWILMCLVCLSLRDLSVL